MILIGDEVKSIEASLFKWLGIRRVYSINMNLLFVDFGLFLSSIESNYEDQFRYTQHVIMRGPMRDNMAIFIISHCLCLLSIDITGLDYCIFSGPKITDHTLQLIAEHCTGLQSLSFKYCREITDTGLINISEHCSNLKLLYVCYCTQLTDTSILSTSTHCTGLQILNLEGCLQLTDASIISISTHCVELHSLNLIKLLMPL